MNLEKLKKLLLGFLFILVQILLFRHLELFGLQPDIVLLYLLWLIMREDRTSAILMAAALGFVQDALLDIWGLNMFAKTAITFFAYRFIPKTDDYQLLIWQAFLLIFIVALFHNIILVGLSFFIEIYTGEYSFWRIVVGNTFYTSILGIILYLFRSR